MKKMLREKLLRGVALGAAVFVSTISFAGCSNTNTAENKGSAVELNGSAIYPIKCDDTLTYWRGTSYWTQKYENLGDTPLGQETEKQTGIKVKYIHPTEGQGTEQFNLLLTSDELPDMIQHDWNNYPGGPDKAISEKYILKLNDLIDKYAPALKKLLSEDKMLDKQIKSDSGSYYAFPFLMEEGILQVAYGPALRGDWMKELNLQTPQTIDDWETVLTAFKEKKKAVAPFTGDLNATLKLFSGAFGVYVDWYKDGESVVYGPMQPGYKDLLAKLNDWYKKGLIDQDIAVVDGKKVTNNMLNGVSGASAAWAGSDIGQWLKANANVKGYDIIGAPYPAAVAGQNAEYTNLAPQLSLSSGVAINAKCKNQELATRFLDFGFTEAGHNLYNFGIEGVSYNWVDGYPTYTDLIMKNPEELPISTAMSLYIYACTNGIMVQDQRYIEQFYPTTQQKDAQQQWMKTNMKEHLLPQLYITGADSDKFSDIMSGVKTYVDEQTLKFITGAEPIENFDKFIAQLNSFGIMDCVKFKQDALERYNNR